MRDFFKPWRRKVGVVTLLMACVLTSGWVRSLNPHMPSPLPSQFVFDEQSWKFGWFVARGDHPVDRLALKDSCVIWERIQADAPIMVTNVIGVWFNATDANFPDLQVQSKEWTSYWEWLGFAVGRFHLREERFDLRIERLVLPFWSLVLPLTLASGFLCLTKPQIWTRRKSPEPIRNS